MHQLLGKAAWRQAMVPILGLFTSASLTALAQANETLPPPQSTPTAQQQDSAPGASAVYTVESCTDGDTCRLNRSNGLSALKVRLVGIDAPEMAKKKKSRKGTAQPGAEDAKAFINGLLVGKTVTAKSYGFDIYGRTLAEIFLDNQSVNLKLVSEGWAQVYDAKKQPGLDLTPFKEAEQAARQARRGIWSLPNHVSPKEWRKMHGK